MNPIKTMRMKTLIYSAVKSGGHKLDKRVLAAGPLIGRVKKMSPNFPLGYLKISDILLFNQFNLN